MDKEKIKKYLLEEEQRKFSLVTDALNGQECGDENCISECAFLDSLITISQLRKHLAIERTHVRKLTAPRHPAACRATDV
jgi:hypothetical protein